MCDHMYTTSAGRVPLGRCRARPLNQAWCTRCIFRCRATNPSWPLVVNADAHGEDKGMEHRGVESRLSADPANLQGTPFS
jgi:hypothetical protein